MKMYNGNKSKSISLFAIFCCLIVFSCNYDEKNLIDGKGDGIVRFEIPQQKYGVNFAVSAFDAVKQTRPIAIINRDAVSNADLNTSVTVTFGLDSSFLRVLNDSIVSNAMKDDPTLVLGVDSFDTLFVLPKSTYTFSAPGLSGTTLTFEAGEAVKELSIELDPATLSFSTSYALPIKISGGSGNNKASVDNGYLADQIIVKNAFDAEYTVNGTLTDFSNSAYDGSCAYPMDVYLITNGPTEVILYDKAIGGDYHSICASGGLSYYGNVGVVIDFDDSGNVTKVSNLYDDAAPRSRTLELDPSGENKFDFSAKTLKIKYWMNQANSVQPHRTSFDETYIYKGPR